MLNTRHPVPTKMKLCNLSSGSFTKGYEGTWKLIAFLIGQCPNSTFKANTYTPVLTAATPCIPFAMTSLSHCDAMPSGLCRDATIALCYHTHREALISYLEESVLVRSLPPHSFRPLLNLPWTDAETPQYPRPEKPSRWNVGDSPRSPNRSAGSDPNSRHYCF